MSSFWLRFVIQEAIGLAEVFIQSSNLTPALKVALEKLIADGQAVIAAL
jgi:hypothetical protein